MSTRSGSRSVRATDMLNLPNGLVSVPERFPTGGQPLDHEPDRGNADAGDKTRPVDAALVQRVFICEDFDLRGERVAQRRTVHLGASRQYAVLDQEQRDLVSRRLQVAGKHGVTARIAAPMG